MIEADCTRFFQPRLFPQQGWKGGLGRGGIYLITRPSYFRKRWGTKCSLFSIFPSSEWALQIEEIKERWTAAAGIMASFISCDRRASSRKDCVKCGIEPDLMKDGIWRRKKGEICNLSILTLPSIKYANKTPWCISLQVQLQACQYILEFEFL